MATITVDYQQAFKNVGLDFAPLAAKGVTVAMNSSGMKFNKDGEVLASVPLAPGKVAELASNPAAAKSGAGQTAKASLQSVFKQLEEKLNGGTPKAAAGFVPTAIAVPMPGVAAPSNVVTLPLDKMKSLTPMKLANATQLFQPVTGTSAGSKYFVVGVGLGIAVAARYKGTKEEGKLSVRIEGPAFPKLTTKIQEAGVFGPAFAGSFDSNYASMHVMVEGKKEAQRVIGAILGSMAPYISHPCPDIQPLLEVA